MGAKMSNDTKWVIGTVVVLGGIIGGLLSAQIQGVSTSLNIRINDLNSSLSMRINDLNTSVSGRIDRFENRLENRFDGLDERLRNVEVMLGKVEGRLVTIERVVLPGSEQPSE